MARFDQGRDLVGKGVVAIVRCRQQKPANPFGWSIGRLYDARTLPALTIYNKHDYALCTVSLDKVPIKLVHAIIVALETAHELRMRGGRPLGVAVRIVTGQALGILRHAGVHIGKAADGRAVHPQVIAVGAAPQDEPNAGDDQKVFHCPHEASLATVPSFK